MSSERKKVYTTQELIEILRAERQACLRGQRLNLTAAAAHFSPVVDPWINTEGVEKFTAYRDFRATVHRYQLKHQVSGLVWRRLTFYNRTLYYPEAEDQLLILPADFETLRQAQASVVHFWFQVTADMDFYRSLNQFRQYEPMVLSEVDRLVERTEWASLSKYEAGDHRELVLLLGWGNPQAALDRQHWPASGCEAIHAVSAGAKPVGHRD